MLRRHISFATVLTSLFAFGVACDSGTSDDDTGTGGSSVTTTGGTGTGTGGVTAPKGGTGTTGGSVTASGGSATSGGSTTVQGGSSTGGSTTVTGGVTASGGSGNTTSTGGAISTTGGSGTTGGSSTTGGTNGGGGAGGGGMPAVIDPKPNATPGTMTSTNQDYLRLGEMRIINNNWGSEDLGCGNKSTMSVFVNQDKTFGWSFNRGDCDTAASNAKPDFPQLEFGIHPFGIGDERATSPEFSSTTLLPIQIKNVQSMTVAIQNLTATFQQESSWNITFEFWISERNPLEPNPGVYAELMTFWGWQNNRWPMMPMGNGSGSKVNSGGKSYSLWVQDDNWGNGQWRYFQFRADDGPQKSFNGTLDVKPFLDYLVNSRQYSKDFWVTRLEVGSEIDDNTQGRVQMSGITFEINGQSRSSMVGP